MSELRQNAGKYLRRVAAGESITITNRGNPVAILVPPPFVAYDKRLLAAAEQAGLPTASPGAS